MFNLFKKKDAKPEVKVTLRDTMMGEMAPIDWPQGDAEGTPWDLFVQARDLLTQRQDFQGAIKLYKQITEMPGLESRHYLQAWHFLRRLNVAPPPELQAKVYGLLVDVRLKNGPEFVAAYEDHRARYLNYTGSSIFWEAPDTSLNETIDALLGICQQIANQLPPLDINKRPNPPQQVDVVQICILTPGGIRHGMGTFDQLSKNPPANEIINGSSYLMKSLIDKTSKK